MPLIAIGPAYEDEQPEPEIVFVPIYLPVIPPEPLPPTSTKCSGCGIDFGEGTWGYVCPRTDCPTFARTICQAPTWTVTRVEEGSSPLSSTTITVGHAVPRRVTFPLFEID